jgi:hypothetical protein
MHFNTHSSLEGRHAFLSASKYHWTNYDEEKLALSYNKFLATQKGTRLHEFASECINLGIKLPKTKNTLNMYVNDAIGYRMAAEQPLFYSENCFGTVDAISFATKQNLLRIHDLKTGESPTSMRQLEIYAALFCLEYSTRPHDIDMELRIYQQNEVMVYEPPSDTIVHIMDKIITFDRRLEKIKIGE